MKLPFLSKKQSEKDFFLALLLSSGEIRSILFEKNGESLLILGTHKQEFSEALDSLTSERLIEISDIVISEVEKSLPEGADLQKTIFAVPDRWVSEGKIVKEHLASLKSLCDALHLTPVGFIVSIEAIIAFLHKKEGMPVTAIVVEIGKKHVTMSLVKNGNILSVSEKEIEDTPVKTVESMLGTQEDLEVLPAKIILLNFDNAKKIQQSFLSHSWSKSLQFLHIPQVEVLDPEVESQAVISGVALQMGFSTLPQVSIDKVEKRQDPIEIASAPEVSPAEGKEEVQVPDANLEEVPDEAKVPLEFKGEEIGFFKEVDVLKKPKETVEATKVSEDNIHVPEQMEPISKDIETPQEIQEEKADTRALAMSSLPSIPRPHLPHMSFSVPKVPTIKGRMMFVYPIIAVILFIVLIVSYYYYFEKAEVNVTLDKKGVNKQLSVAFSLDKSTSASDSVVHIDSTSVQVDGKEEQSTTGKKETGDKATGEVTLYNKTDSPKTFSKGTLLVGPNNLEFDLTGDVKIASTSSFSTSFSSTNAKVEADKFGKEYNIPSGSNFQVKGQSTSDYFAKNNSAFSGGTKKEVTVVSADDIASLQTKVSDTLLKKAMSEANSKIGDGSQVLPAPLDISFDDKSYSKKAGDQADTVSLAATITYKLGSYKKSDLISLAKDVTSKDAPSDYKYSGKDSEVQIKDVKNDEGDISGKLVFSSVFLPQVSPEDIAGKLAGKSTQKADEILNTPGISGNNVNFTRSLPFFPKILPFNKKNIVIITQSK